MTTTQAPPSALPSFDKAAKMEDRKRSLAPTDGDELFSRPGKRLVKDENGQAMRMDAEKEKEVENFQKDAIMRQLKEYKRQKKDFEDQYNDLSRKCKHHDENLRIIDAWWVQLLDEVRVIVGQKLSTPPPSATSTFGEETYGSALLFENSELFSTHLRSRSENIKGAIADLFGRLPSVSPDLEDARRQLNEVLAREKEQTVKYLQALDDKDSLNGRWEAAVERYMMAEKKLDRAKSAQVLKLERQAIMGGNGEAASPTTSKATATPVKKEHSAEVNGEQENGVLSAEADAARREALATAERQRQQVEEIEAENERLTNELSAARTKLVSLTDDDYAETSLCKTLKSQYEDVVKRINDLEATNVQLREEAQKLHSERTSYRRQVDEEDTEQTIESETQIARAETDLARIRNIRDELTAELSVRKQAEEGRRMASEQAKELAAARDSKITALESEIERLRLKLGESQAAEDSNLDELEAEELRSRLRALQSQHEMLSNELSSMEAAWKKTSALASRKVEEIQAQEDTVARLQAEKAKADQKYFAAMKAKDMREGELRSLKIQNARSGEIVSQLKDTEGKSRELVANLERQVAEARDGLAKLETQYRGLEQKGKEAGFASEGLKKQVEEMSALTSSKDKENLALAKARREVETELERTQTRLEDSKKQVETLKKSNTADSNTSEESWRRLAICSVCNRNLRNAVLKLCGHCFCQECVKDLIANRNRKCPTCTRAFGNGDHMAIVLT